MKSAEARCCTPPPADIPLRRWGAELEIPLPFGRTMTAAEEYVHSLDGNTGASLKLSILNPKVLLLGTSPSASLAAGVPLLPPPWPPGSVRPLVSLCLLGAACAARHARPSKTAGLVARHTEVEAADEMRWDAQPTARVRVQGRIWTMVAGGGASVIYADTVGDLGYAHELGNYAEYR